MENLPKISIVTPSFNQGKFLEQTILSVISQGYPNLEYIIIDGGSSDNSLEIIKKYEKHLTYWVSEKDNGQTHAINKGFAKATGEIFNWLNSDDWYEKDTLFNVAEAFDKNTEVIFGKINSYNTNKSIISELPDMKGKTADTLLTINFVNPSTFFRKKILDAIFPLNENLHYAMDLELWFKYVFIFGARRGKNIDDVLVNFRLHESSKTILKEYEFRNDKANILYSLLMQNRLYEEASFLSKQFRIIPGYIFEIDIKKTNKELIKRIFISYLLAWTRRLFQKRDFTLACYVKSFFPHYFNFLSDEDKYMLSQINKKTIFNSWLFFRTKRKLLGVYRNG